MKKKMQRAVSILLIVLMICTAFPVWAGAAQYSDEERKQYAKAVELKQLGLLQGVSATDYALEEIPTRVQTVIMLVRLLGDEKEALSKQWSHPFTDVPDWADCYIGYAYQTGYIKGASKTLFDPDQPANANMYLTIVLRVLGYTDGADGDFLYQNPYILAQSTGILTQKPKAESFTRGDAVTVSYAALGTLLKGTDKSLLARLYDNQTVSLYSIVSGGHEAKARGSSLQGYKTVTVSSGEELINAIASNTEIILKPGTYNLSAINRSKITNKNISFEPVFDGEQLMIKNVENCYLIGNGTTDAVELVVEPRYAAVLTYENCKNCFVSGMTMGHMKGKGYCTGSVVVFSGSSDSCVADCVLYGCGAYGVDLQQADNIFVRDSEIKECTYGGVTLLESDHSVFLNCNLHDCESFATVDIRNSSNTEFAGCDIHDNMTNGTPYDEYLYMFDFNQANDARFSMCSITSNQSSAYFMDINASKNVVFDRCIFQDNGYSKFLRGDSGTDVGVDYILVNGEQIQAG